MGVGLFVYQHLFSSRETKFLINLLRTHPRFRSATWPLLIPQVPLYPLGRDQFSHPASPRRERKLNELLPRHQQYSVRCLTIPVPAPELSPLKGRWRRGTRQLKLIILEENSLSERFEPVMFGCLNSVDSHGLSFFVCQRRYCPTKHQ